MTFVFHTGVNNETHGKWLWHLTVVMVGKKGMVSNSMLVKVIGCGNQFGILATPLGVYVYEH